MRFSNDRMVLAISLGRTSSTHQNLRSFHPFSVSDERASGAFPIANPLIGNTAAIPPPPDQSCLCWSANRIGIQATTVGVRTPRMSVCKLFCMYVATEFPKFSQASLLQYLILFSSQSSALIEYAYSSKFAAIFSGTPLPKRGRGSPHRLQLGSPAQSGIGLVGLPVPSNLDWSRRNAALLAQKLRCALMSSKST